MVEYDACVAWKTIVIVHDILDDWFLLRLRLYRDILGILGC